MFKSNAKHWPEGSLKSIWKFLGKNEKQLKLIGAILAGILITAPLTYWQALNLKIDYEIKQEELKKLKKEALESDTLPTAKVQEVVRNLQEDYKVSQHLSNIYTTVNEYSEVIQVSTHELDADNKPIAPERSVPKSEFQAFLLEPCELDPNIDEEAIIEIVSPVLKAERYVWTGVYLSRTAMRLVAFLFPGSPDWAGTPEKCSMWSRI